jgi:rRNA maturation endonuclease Nob1
MQKMFSTLFQFAGASHWNNLKDPTYSLLRSALELMLLLNRDEAATYAFMLARVYLQLDINHEVNQQNVFVVSFFKLECTGCPLSTKPIFVLIPSR